MTNWFWFRIYKGGRSPAHWLSVGRNRGYQVDSDDAPCMFDNPLEGNIRPTPENLRSLRQIVVVMRDGDKLGVPLIGMFGTLQTWTHIAVAFVKKRCVVHDLETDRIFDLSDPVDLAEGADLLAAQVNAIRIAPAQEGRRHSLNKGGPKRKLIGRRAEEARLLWAMADEMTAGQIADKFGISIMTLYRAMTDNGRIDGKPVSRRVARIMHEDGRWMK